MKIKELNITKFGPVRNLNIKMDENMNYIHGFDDDVKTAVLDFIVVMFYGTVNNFREDIREKYLPLDGTDMSGSVVFEFLDEEYLLERVFNSRRYKNDTIKLTNCTKEISEELAYNIKPGEILFGASKDIFVRNTFINDHAAELASKGNYSKTMSPVLSNLISTANETISVSGVASMLNSYCDPSDPESISYAMNEKKEEVHSLKETLAEAVKTENEKLEHQQKCNTLHSKYAHEQRKYNRIKESIEVQNMLNELDSINSAENNEQSFVEASEKYNQLNSDLKKSRILENRNTIDRAYENFKRIRSLRIDQDKDLQKKTNLSVDLGRYTPKGDSSSLQNVITLQNDIEKAEETIRTLHVQMDEKRKERNQIKEKVHEAKERVREAENALTRQEEMSRNKIAQAEETLHSASYSVETKVVNKSKNLVFAIIVLAVLIALLIVFLNNIVIVAVLGFGILTVIYAIINKLGKEKKVKSNTRVDENQLRINERNLRNIRNQCSSEREIYVSKLAVVKNQYDEIKRRDNEYKKQLSNLENEIKTTENKLSEYIAQKDSSEKNISQPDPKFYSIRTEINEIERSTELRAKNIEDLQKSIISELSAFRKFESFSEADAFLENTMNSLSEYDKLSEKLSVLGDKEKSRMIADANVKRAAEINSLIEKAEASGITTSRLSDEEYRSLQTISQQILENTLSIKDEYISEITKLKIKYNDSTCVANTEHRIHRLEREAAEIDNYIKTVKLAIASYNEALTDIHDEYAPKIARKTSEILSALTKGKYTGISVKGGKLIVKDKDKNPVNFDAVSKSTCDLIYFSLRLAVAEVTAGKMNYPVILDDIFLGFSEAKSSELLKFFKEYAKESQILVFSSTNRITSVAANEQIPIDDVNIIAV